MKPKDENNLFEPISPLHEGINSYGLRRQVSRPRPISSNELRQLVAELMTSVAQSCIDAGAKDIGHIKAFIEHDTGFLHASTVGDPADVTVEGRDGDPVNHLALIINSVVYGLSKDAVKDSTERSLKNVLSKFGMKKESDPKQQPEIK